MYYEFVQYGRTNYKSRRIKELYGHVLGIIYFIVKVAGMRHGFDVHLFLKWLKPLPSPVSFNRDS